MLNLLQEVAIMSENGGQIARLSNVMDGVDGAATFGYTIEEGSFAIEDNQKVQRYHDHTLDIRLLNDPVAEGIIDGIISAGERAYIAGYTPDGFLCFDEPVVIARNPQYDQNIVSAFSARKRTLCGYTEGSDGFYKSIYAGRNLLALYDVTRSHIVTGGTTFSGFKGVSGLTQTLTAGSLTFTGSTDRVESNNLFFALPQIVKLTVNVEDITGVSDPELEYGFRFFDESNTQIGSDVTDTTGSTGVKTITTTVPAGTAYVRVMFRADVSTTSVTLTQPRVTRGNNTAFSL